MSDLIDRQAAIDRIEHESREWGDEYGISDVLCDLSDMPSAQLESAIPKEWDEAYRIASNIRMAFGIDTAEECWELVQNHEIERVKHGRWVYKPNEYDDLTYECSICKEPWTLIDGTPEENNMHYCPNCGAKMEG